jgi:predicted nuclease of restriction endonuclease-like RecB superfamily
MLTADLVTVQRRGDTLKIRAITDEQRSELLAAASAYLAILTTHVGKSQLELDKAWDEVESNPTSFKLMRGLRKLIEDRCTFAVPDDLDAPALRRAVFTLAAARRRDLADGDHLDVQQILQEAAPQFADREGSREAWLFGDLKEQQVLAGFEPIEAPTLVASYEWAQKQAVLLRAVRVRVILHDRDTGGVRQLFRLLKFRRLLYSIQREGEGYAIEIDGPFSLFQAVTKYGLGLALLLPALDDCGPWSLDADVRWDKTTRVHRFHLEGGQNSPAPGRVHLPDDVAALVSRVKKLGRGWSVAPSDAILDLPGLGLCIPDLVFRHGRSREPYYLEVMGFWSRDAVWRRVELVQAGLPHRILFAVSSRLRVSERVLDGELPGQLYVYKGTMMANEVLDRLDAMRPARQRT